MEHIFYVVGIAWIIYEYTFISNIKEKMQTTKRTLELQKELKGKSYSQWSEEYKDIAISVLFFQLPLYIWLFVGLFTFQWVIFLYFIAQLYLLTGLPRWLFGIESKIYMVCVWINSLIGLLMGLFVILNKYHFRIDVYELLKNTF